MIKTEYYVIWKGVEETSLEKTKEEILKNCQRQEIADECWKKLSV